MIKQLEIVMTKGLPASGKSTWARDFVAENPTWKRVNKDDLRMMMHDGVWTKENEKQIVNARDALIITFLSEGFNVIVDDTNFHPSHQYALEDIAADMGAKFTVKYFDANPRVCIERDLGRDKPVGSKVIMDMYFKHARPEKAERNDDLPNAVLCDIDGTLAIMGDRSPYDWSKVGVDTVNQDIRHLLIPLAHDKDIILVSGRDESCREQTIAWLEENDVPYDKLIMRKEGDNRKDVIVKQEIYLDHIQGQYNVTAVFDDRDQVVDMWREQGLTCLQVNYGSF